jgi:formylglycine-generating enzyme required for sulfatase activity
MVNQPTQSNNHIDFMITTSRILSLFLALTAVSRAASPVTVPIGNAGNTSDGSGYGAVAYEYRIGKFEVTNEEFCEFLNGAAKTDSYESYDGRMAEQYGGIYRSGEQGTFIYTVKDGMGKKPVNFVGWLTCLRYANWLSNGKGAGATETGTYTISGGTATLPTHAALAAGKTVKWALPTENEWYKAAYYDAAKPGGAGYWTYAVKGGSAPECNINSDTPTDAGQFKTAVSPNGTFDQNGNVWEYNENMSGDKVGLRVGSFFMNDRDEYLLSYTRYDVYGAKWPNYGFRVVALGGSASEPAKKEATKK